MDIYTGLHEDGVGGDQESMHFNMKGRSEVILLPTSLTVIQKRDVFLFLNGFQVPIDAVSSEKHKELIYQRQFIPPHAVSEDFWIKSFPTTNQLQNLKDATGIECELLILEPSQLLFIDAGRLHIFRKMGYTKLPETDPFHEMRKKYLHEDHFSELNSNRWSVAIAWDFVYIGFTKKGILRLASQKWLNSIYAARSGYGSQGCIETPLMILLTKYGETSKETRKRSLMKRIDMLLNALEPLIYNIIKHQGDKLPFRENTGIGTVINTTLSNKYNVHREVLANSLINFRCDSGSMHLSNHFLTCRTCLTYGDYTVDICTSCYKNKSREELFANIKSMIHVREIPEPGKETVIRQNKTKPKFETTSAHQFWDKRHSTRLLLDLNPEHANMNRMGKDDSCAKLKVSCFEREPKSSHCHTSYELVHLWATESDIRRIYCLNQKNGKTIDI